MLYDFKFLSLCWLAAVALSTPHPACAHPNHGPGETSHYYTASTTPNRLSSTKVAAGSPVTVTRVDGQPATKGIDPLLKETIRQNKRGEISTTTSSNFGMHVSVIRVPDWIPAHERPHPSAKYYLYTAGHSDNQIRMLWADSLTGVWQQWNPLADDEHDGRAWGKDGNNTGALTRGSGVLDLEIGPLAPPVNKPNGDPAERGHYIDIGDLELEDHISSPEVIVDDANQRIILVFHAMYRSEKNPRQTGTTGRYHRSVMGTSKYGLNFNTEEDGGEKGHGLRDFALSGAYSRLLQVEGEFDGKKVVQSMMVSHTGKHDMAPLFTEAGENATLANADQVGGLFNPGPGYVHTKLYHWPSLKPEGGGPKDFVRPHAGALRYPGIIAENFVFPNGKAYEPGPPTRDGARHVDVWYDAGIDRDTIYYFYTAARDMPESILMTRVSLAGLTEEERLDPTNWKRIDEQEHLILKPEVQWEGIEHPLKPSASGAISKGNLMRDPHIFHDKEAGKLYLFYNANGESMIGLAEVHGIATQPKVEH